MLWRSIFVRDRDSTLRQCEGADAVELRLDYATAQLVDDLDLASWSCPVLASYHGPDPDYGRALVLGSGASWIDLPYQPGSPFASQSSAAHSPVVVGSWHDYEKTPPRDELLQLIEAIFCAGADVAKIACYCHSYHDAARLLGLLDDPRPIVALGMGPQGALTRVAGELWQTPLAFVPGVEPTAPGQLPEAHLRTIVALMQESA
ncbi:MAG: type I 3-dehydroquinate dehydratase [Propionibacteriaceae bacterium]